jgi:hypothetical protein
MEKDIQKKLNIQTRFSIEFEFKLKSTATTTTTTVIKTLTERVKALTKRIKSVTTLVGLLFGVKRIFTVVEFGAFFYDFKIELILLINQCCFGQKIEIIVNLTGVG